MGCSVEKGRINHLVVTLAVAAVLVACGGSAETAAGEASRPAFETISAQTLHARLQPAAAAPLIVDVREPHEFEAGHIEGALLAPLGEVVQKLEGTDKNREIVLVCRSGRRSGIAAGRLAASGYSNLANVDGGMLAWEKLAYPVVRE